MDWIQNFAPIPVLLYRAVFETEQLFFLFKRILQSGRTIIGFDLNETGVSESDWDANVSARILFKLCNLLVASNPA